MAKGLDKIKLRFEYDKTLTEIRRELKKRSEKK